MELVLETAVKKLGWNPAQVEMEFQESGLTNWNCIVSNGTEKVVIRINGSLSRDLGINRHAELAAMEAVSALEITPELLFFDTEMGYMVTRFIEGRTWGSKELAQNVDRVGTLLKKVHTIAEIGFEFSPYRDIEARIQTAIKRGQQLPPSLDRMLERLHQISALREAAPDHFRGLCHNDPFANNFMDNGSIRLLDWEFAGMGDIMYDLACISQSMGYERQTELLQAYFGYSSPELLQALQDMDYVVSFWNAMWAMTMLAAAPHTGFDYNSLAQTLFQKLELALASPS